jgi:exonuclease SbcC
VTDYVARQLVGLPHGAFVSTFFTRQKELSFFGDRTPTERRVEVARLLGFQTVRDAQEEIGNERSQARQAALSLSAQYAEGSLNRDFPVEIAAAEATLEEARAREVEATEASSAAEAEVERTRAALDAWRALQEQDNELGTTLAGIAGQMTTAASRRDAATAELTRLDQRSAERTKLVGEAKEVGALAFEVSLLDEQRERAERLRSLQETERASRERIGAIGNRIGGLVSERPVDGMGCDGWFWGEADRTCPEQGINRLQRAAISLNPREARDRVEALRNAQTMAKAATEKREVCDRFRQLHETLAARRASLLVPGDPTAAIAAAQESARRAREASTAAKEQLARFGKSREDAVRIGEELRHHVQEPLCPTCARPLGAAEAERLAGLLDKEVRDIREAEDSLKREEKIASKQIVEAERAETEARQRHEELRSIEVRLGDGLEKIAEAEREHTHAVESLENALRAAAASQAPTNEEIENARIFADRIDRTAGLLPLLEQLAEQVATAVREIADAEAAIAELGPVTYEVAAHRTAQLALDRARAAVARIEQIDMELVGRARYEEQREVSARELLSFADRRVELESARAALGFDPARLRGAQEEESVARATARIARDTAAEARDALRDARAARNRVVEERDRLMKLAEEAERCGREADELERMYREFAEFDKFVADHVGPLLAETTERLLSLVTHGKYDRVRFDENYGIEVFDGDECFKLEGFSGGERDVVALCARLAMSELVGSSAVRPPRFLVLDEVFGSLDSDRRAQLLETLGSLAYGGHFQQMFIISHVDDVQLSPVMNEAWTIEERAGVSHVVRPQLLEPALA